MNTVFSDQDHARISDAIRAAEARTTGSIVTVVARQAEPYTIIAALWSATAAIIAGLVAGMFWPAGLSAGFLPLGQVGVFLLALLVLQFMPLRMALVPRAVKHRRAARLARTAFLSEGLHNTEARAGILIFAAMGEHYVEIIADKGINDRVDEDTWQSLVDHFTGHMRRGTVISGFVETIAACGDVLAEHFPGDDRNINELPDHLIEI